MPSPDIHVDGFALIDAYAAGANPLTSRPIWNRWLISYGRGADGNGPCHGGGTPPQQFDGHDGAPELGQGRLLLDYRRGGAGRPSRMSPLQEQLRGQEGAQLARSSNGRSLAQGFTHDVHAERMRRRSR